MRGVGKEIRRSAFSYGVVPWLIKIDRGQAVLFDDGGVSGDEDRLGRFKA